MITDKEQELINDVLEENESNCCGAKVYIGRCNDCKENCE